MVSPLHPPQAYAFSNHHHSTGVRAKLSHVIHDVVRHISGVISRRGILQLKEAAFLAIWIIPAIPAQAIIAFGVISPVAVRRTSVTQSWRLFICLSVSFTSM